MNLQAQEKIKSFLMKMWDWRFVSNLIFDKNEQSAVFVAKSDGIIAGLSRATVYDH